MSAPTPERPFIIAVDAGGTRTRVGCFDLDGALLSTVVGGGGSPHHNRDSERNVADALDDALRRGGLRAADAVGLGAGVAGVNRADSNQASGPNDWARGYFDIPSLVCPRLVVNDAVIAHRGALLGRAGIVVLAGTGSMILAVSDTGVQTESGQFEHYAGAARHLAFRAMQLLLAGEAVDADSDLVSEILAYGNVAGLLELRESVLRLAHQDRFHVNRWYGRLAPTITAAADSSPLADRALTRIVNDSALGVAVLATLVGTDPVTVTTAGALATDPRFTHRLADTLYARSGAGTRLVRPVLGPLGGAALLAYEAAGIAPGASVIQRIEQTQPAD